MSRYKSFSFKMDTQAKKVEDQYKVEWSGMWSPREVDRMYTIAKRSLRQYKQQLLETDRSASDDRGKRKSSDK